jgi:hypothetical protein
MVLDAYPPTYVIDRDCLHKYCWLFDNCNKKYNMFLSIYNQNLCIFEINNSMSKQVPGVKIHQVDFLSGTTSKNYSYSYKYSKSQLLFLSLKT